MPLLLNISFNKSLKFYIMSTDNNQNFMTQREINLVDQMLFLMQRMDSKLLNNLVVYANGLVTGAATDEDQDWWDDLTSKDLADLEESISDGEQGREKPMEEVFKKYGL